MNNKRFVFLLTLFFSQTVFSQSTLDPVEEVNPLMGTQSSFRLSSGNTYPGITLPWGMNCWMAQTGKMGDGWSYTYDADKIRGFKQTHQPSPWINDYGQFSIMPVTGSLKFRENERASYFSHKTEIAKPYYYSVYLADHDVTTEFTPTERAVSFQITFPKTDSAFIVVDAFNKGSYIKIIPAEKKIIGYTTRNSGGVPANFKNYFVAYFDKPFAMQHAWHDSVLTANDLELTTDHAGAVVGFATSRGEKVHIKMASSFISFEQAELNLKREIGNDGFDVIKQKAKAAWNAEMKKVMVEGGSEAQIKTFYSCLYRVLMFPRKFHEINANNQTVHYSPYNGMVLPGFMYTDNGFWDTFRAVFPLFNLLFPEHNSEVMEGLANAYKESGWLPEWQSPGHRDCMIGSNSASIIADAYLKGLRGFDINALYDGILKNANNAGPLSSVGRMGADYYNKLGYVPYDVGINENTARTLEYAYDDFTVWQLAKKLNRPADEIALFEKRCQNYRNVFDPETKLMRGKNKDGNFMKPFSPFKWGDAFTEGNSWHYTWSVFHDVAGLKKLMGGSEMFTKMLDSVFVMPPVFDDSYYGFPIHEIREMQIMGMGQYAHGNQPIQHMIYLYNYAGQPWKTQYWIRQVMNKLYAPTPDGYCGDEDNGQTSAWYVFGAMGFYPVCPGTNQYVLGTPLFKSITLKMPSGKTLVLQAPNNSSKNLYINAVNFNGQPYGKNYLEYEALQKGGKIVYTMSDKPNYRRGTNESSFPYSFSK